MKVKPFYRETQRLIVRPLKLSDFKVWLQAINSMQPEINKFDSFSATMLAKDKTNFTALVLRLNNLSKKESYCLYGIFLKATGEVVGYCSLGNFVRSLTQSAMMGYQLFNHHWGKGYAEEAVNVLIDIAFLDYKIHRLQAGIEPENKKSIQLIKKLGFRKEGLFKRVLFLRKNWIDLAQYGLTVEDRGLKWKG